MTCIHCGGQLRRGGAPFHLDRKGVHFQFDAVSSWVCEQCGEQLLDEVAVESIQAIIKAVDEQSERLSHSA